MGPLRFVDLTQERALRAIVDRSCAAHGLRRRSMFEVSAVEAMLQFVAAGLGVSIVPLALAKASKTSARVAYSAVPRSRLSHAKAETGHIGPTARSEFGGQTVQNLMLEALTHTFKETAETRRGDG